MKPPSQCRNTGGGTSCVVPNQSSRLLAVSLVFFFLTKKAFVERYFVEEFEIVYLLVVALSNLHGNHDFSEIS